MIRKKITHQRADEYGLVRSQVFKLGSQIFFFCNPHTHPFIVPIGGSHAAGRVTAGRVDPAPRARW